jgi:hypothetical protein
MSADFTFQQKRILTFGLKCKQSKKRKFIASEILFEVYGLNKSMYHYNTPMWGNKSHVDGTSPESIIARNSLHKSLARLKRHGLIRYVDNVFKLTAAGCDKAWEVFADIEAIAGRVIKDKKVPVLLDCEKNESLKPIIKPDLIESPVDHGILQHESNMIIKRHKAKIAGLKEQQKNILNWIYERYKRGVKSFRVAEILIELYGLKQGRYSLHLHAESVSPEAFKARCSFYQSLTKLMKRGFIEHNQTELKYSNNEGYKLTEAGRVALEGSGYSAWELRLRINRIYAKDHEYILKTARRKGKTYNDCGRYFICNAKDNTVIKKNINLENLGHELKALHTYEHLKTDQEEKPGLILQLVQSA